MATARRTTDHDEIREWAEARGGRPARVKATGNRKDPGILRIDFPGFSGEGSLEEISWDEFFEWFDRDRLALLISDAKKNRFNKLVARGGARKSGTASAAKRSGTKARSSATGTASKTSTAKAAAKKRAGGRSSATAKRSASATKKAATKKAATKKTAAKKTAAKKTSPAKRPAASRKQVANASSPAKRSAASRSTSVKRTVAGAGRTAARPARTSAKSPAKTAGRSAGKASTASKRRSTGAKPGSGAAAAKPSRSRSAVTTTDHDEIRRWVEARGGFPAHVKRTGRGKDPGVLRIDYPGFSGRRSLERMDWDDWFDAFDRDKLAFLYQDRKDSRFSKLVNR